MKLFARTIEVCGACPYFDDHWMCRNIPLYRDNGSILSYKCVRPDQSPVPECPLEEVTPADLFAKGYYKKEEDK